MDPPASLIADTSICSDLGLPTGCLADAQLLSFHMHNGDDEPYVARCLADADIDTSPATPDINASLTPMQRETAERFGLCPFRRYQRMSPFALPPHDYDSPGPSGEAYYWYPGAQLDRAVDSWYVGAPEGSPTEIPYVGYDELVDALEVVCLAQNTSGGCSPSLEELPVVRSLADVDRLAERLECSGQQIESIAGRLTLSGVPDDIARQLRTGSIEPTFPAFQGEFGSTVGELRAVLEELPRSLRIVGSTLRDFSGRIQIARSELEIEDLERDMDQWNLLADIANQAARCAGSARADSYILSGGAVAAQCVAAAAGILAAVQTTTIRAAIGDEHRRQIFITLAMDFGERMDALAEAEANLKTGYSRANSLLSRLDSLRNQARRAAGKALMLDQDEVGQEFAVNTVMRARMSTTRIRYERARRSAVQLSWLARRAIEQRLGVDMSKLWDDMSLVPPPATWADGVCSMPGIDYGRIRGDLPGGVDDYADGYVGDYVALLENFIESYRLDFPFTDAGDIAVLSLRDDILGVRDRCPEQTKGWNLLFWSEDLSQLGDGAGWAYSCVSGERCPSTVALPDVTPFVTRDETAAGLEVRRRPLGGGSTFELHAGCPVELVDSSGACTAAPGGAAAQVVELEPGEYLVSWHEPLDTSLEAAHVSVCSDPSCLTDCGGDGACEAGCVDVDCLREGCAADATAETPKVTVEVVHSATGTVLTSVAPVFVSPSDDAWIDACHWRRAYARFTVELEGMHEVRLSPVMTSADTAPTISAILAAPQLEEVPRELAHLASVAPRPYFPTQADLFGELALCEDTDGDLFRSERYWQRTCEYICPDGIGGACVAGDEPPSRSLLRCFWEAHFALNLPDIERGNLIPTGGFAVGNFNYRFADFGVNLVGVGVRDCSTAELPSACYSSGFIPYSLTHDRPYLVRNHVGETVESPLFVGHVEHAKSLTAERYLTNPLSSADRALLADYMRGEFEGRPITGNYTLRVYDAPGLNWERLEDVQLVLNYKYWTRFE